MNSTILRFFTKRCTRWVSRVRSSLFVAVIATTCHPAQAKGPAWVNMGDKEFAHKFAQEATSDDLKARSTIAWMLFARVNQPAPNNIVAWESWPSNEDTFDTPATRFAPEKKVRPRPHLQPSIVHQLMNRKRPFSVPGKAGEEITRNKISYDYIWDNKLNTATTAWDRLSKGPALNFPIGAVEIKADWQTGPVLKGAYSSTDATGTTYYLVGLHIMAKVAPTPADVFYSEEPSWFWTTFEYQENPGLSNAQSFLTYHDALARKESMALLTKAGLDSSAFANYVCNGTQISYSTPTKQPVILGNTTMEAFGFTPPSPKGGPLTSPAAWKTWQISCHSCHGSGSANGISTATNRQPFVTGNLFINYSSFQNDVMVGALPPGIADGGYQSFDFVWSIWRAK